MSPQLENRFVNLITRLGGDGYIYDVTRDLFKRYEEPHRSYHNLAHIAEGLEMLDELKGASLIECSAKPQFPSLVELAWWYHDAIYEVRRKDSEKRSAALCRADCTKLRFPLGDEFGDYVVGLILATQHSSPMRKIDDQIIVDLDLMRLGAPPEQWNTFCQMIAEEYAERYSGYTAAEYREGRRKFLSSMLEREQIYCTSYFCHRYEIQARANLTEALEKLKLP